MAIIKSIEEKAKAYDEASKWMEGIYPTLTHEQQMEAEVFFQIFKESEDEKIRKWLISQLKIKSDDTNSDLNIMINKAISWLEKQDEQKETLCDKCKKAQPSHSCQDITALGRCALEKQGEQKLTKFERAVKQVMEEAIECGDTRSLKADAEMLLSLAHNSSWSEEDDIMKQNCHQMLALLRPNSSELIKDIIDNCHHWLKSLKDRVQPKQEWSVEDNERIEQICEDLKCGLINFKSGRTVKGLHFEEIIESNIDWLKSLRPQSTWKPSDEQIEALEHFIVYHNGSTNYAKDLEELRLQLKKLREE